MLTARDRQRLAGVHPTLAAVLEATFIEMESRGFPMFVVSGVRTEAEQQALYAKGRSAPGTIVTYKDGVKEKSDHQVETDGYGHAVDCAFVPTKNCASCFDQQWPWEMFGQLLEQRGVQWGGRFKKPADLDHAQYVVPNSSTGV